MRIKIYTVAVPQLQLTYMFEFLSINTHPYTIGYDMVAAVGFKPTPSKRFSSQNLVVVIPVNNRKFTIFPVKGDHHHAYYLHV